MGKAGSPVCRYVDYTCYIEREECNDTKIIFIALSMRKLLTRNVRPTQREQTIDPKTLRRELKREIREGNMYLFRRLQQSQS